MAWRWRIINEKTVYREKALPNFLWHWRHLLISLWFGLALPSSVGSDGVRIWALTRVDVSLGQAANSVILDRISALLAVVAMIAATLPLFAGRLIDQGQIVWIGALVVLAVAGFLTLAYMEKILDRWKHNRFVGFCISMSKKSRIIFSSPRVIASAVCIHLITACSFYFTAVAVGIEVGLSDVLLIMPTVIFLSALPVSISGWGVREASIVFGLGLFGVVPADALAASVLFGLCSVAVGLCGGLAYLGNAYRLTAEELEADMAVSGNPPPD